MARMVVSRGGMAVVGLALALGAGTPPAVAAPAQPAAMATATPDWRLFTAFGSCAEAEVNSVTATGPNAAWTTGQYFTAGVECRGPYLLVGRWNGTSWQELRSPAGFGPTIGTAVAALSEDYSWTFALRYVSYSPATQSFALLRDGALWRIFRLADDSDITSAAAFSRSDAWAFGSISDGSGGSTAAYAARFNGRTWRRVPVPVAVQATSLAGRSDIWAVGTLGGSGGFALAHWTGTWRTIPFPDLHLPSRQNITGAWVVHDNSGGAWVSATISQSNDGGHEVTGVLLHWTPSSGWAKVALPVKVRALGPLAGDGQGGLWITSYPTSLGDCTDECVDVEMLDNGMAGSWTKAVVPVDNLKLFSMRLIPGTTSLWAGGIFIDSGGHQFARMIKYGP